MPYPAALGRRPLEAQEAYEALQQYAADYGREPLLLLMHAALPETLRADLLALIRLNFRPRGRADASLDADVLFAPFTTALGGGYHRIDAQVRRHALALLRSYYRDDRRPRALRVAELLWRYVESTERRVRRGADPTLAGFLDVQRWVALSFLDPAAAAQAFADALRQAGEVAPGGGVALRLGGLGAALELPLGHRPELIAYARGLDALADGDDTRAQALLGALGDAPLRFGEVELEAPAALLARHVAAPAPAAPATGLRVELAANRRIPADSPAGIVSQLLMAGRGPIESIAVEVEIRHRRPADLVVSLQPPDGPAVTLHERASGNVDGGLKLTLDSTHVPALERLLGLDATGHWQLHVQDLAPGASGRLVRWALRVLTRGERAARPLTLEDAPRLPIPDDDARGLRRTLQAAGIGRLAALELQIDISHSYIGDLRVSLVSPAGTEVMLHDRSGGATHDLVASYSRASVPALDSLAGQPISGAWTLRVADLAGQNVGRLNRWSLRLFPDVEGTGERARRRRVFLSYVRDYLPFARRLADALAPQVAVDWDQTLASGDTFEARLADMLAGADAVVAVAGRLTASRPAPSAEARRTIALGKRLIPVFVDPVEAPAELRERMCANVDADGRILYLAELEGPALGQAIELSVRNILAALDAPLPAGEEAERSPPALHAPAAFLSAEPPSLDDVAWRFLAAGGSWFAAPTSGLLAQTTWRRAAAAVVCARPTGYLRRMVDVASDRDFVQLLAGRSARRWDAVLLSVGGDDLLEAVGAPARTADGQAFAPDRRLLLEASEWGSADAGVSRFVSDAGWARFEGYLQANLDTIVARRDAGPSKGMPLFLHTFPSPEPGPEAPERFGGPWLLPAFDRAGVPRRECVALAVELVDRLNRVLASMAADFRRYPHTYCLVVHGGLLPPAGAGAVQANRWLVDKHIAPGGHARLAQAWSVEIERILAPA